jgi:hypothetical protein
MSKNLNENSGCARARTRDHFARLETFCFRGRVYKFAQREADFRRFEFRCLQIAFVKDIAESRYNIKISIRAVVRAFDCLPSHVQSAFAHELDEPGRRRKCTDPDPDREQQILDSFRQNTEQNTP